MNNSKLSKQQKLILLALKDAPIPLNHWFVFGRIVLIATGVDTDELERERRQFHHSRNNRYIYKKDTLPRPEYDESRRKSNKAFATVSRAIRKLVQRGLVAWQVEPKYRYPILTTEGHGAVSHLVSNGQSREMTSRINSIDESLTKKHEEQRKELAKITSQLRNACALKT